MKERGAKEEELYAVFKAEMEEEEAEARDREARDERRRKKALEQQQAADRLSDIAQEPYSALNLNNTIEPLKEVHDHVLLKPTRKTTKTLLIQQGVGSATKYDRAANMQDSGNNSSPVRTWGPTNLTFNLPALQEPPMPTIQRTIQPRQGPTSVMNDKNQPTLKKSKHVDYYKHMKEKYK